MPKQSKKTKKQSKVKPITFPMIQSLIGKKKTFVKLSSGKTMKYKVSPNLMIHKSKKMSIMIKDGVLNPSSVKSQEKKYAHIELINPDGDYEMYPIEFTPEYPEGIVKGLGKI
jgi:hypothetical protein